MINRRFRLFAWSMLPINLGVILWGTFVRATGSGAGCGSHWPTCDGQVIPRIESTEKLIEFTHRLTSGMVMILALVLLVWAFRAYPRGHLVRRGAAWSMAFMLIEAGVGAALVLNEWVADNDSMVRAVIMSLHLVNTFLLIGAFVLTALWASGWRGMRLAGQGIVTPLLGIGFVAMLVLAASGGVTALGDTLFPGSTTYDTFSPTAHLLLRLRIFHPMIALVTGMYLVAASLTISRLRPSKKVLLPALALVGLFAAQVVVGFVNLAWSAPVWLQLVHLMMADFVWTAFVVLAAGALELSPSPAVSPERERLQPAV